MDEEPQKRRRRRRRKSKDREQSVFRIAAVGVTALTVIVAPELLGGVFGWGIAVVAIGAVIAAALAFVGFRGGRGDSPLPMVALVGAIALAYTGFQALPLPCSLISSIAPASAEAALLTGELLDDGEMSCTISRDPGATRAYFVHGAAIFALFLAAWLAASRGFRRPLFLAVAASVVLIALVSLGHEAAGLSRVFGLYAPVEARPRLLSPLLNGNHLAGFMVLGIPLMVALALDAREIPQRAGWLCAATMASAVVLFTLSRGGIAILVLEALLLPVALIGPSAAKERKKLRGPLIGAGVILAGLGIGVSLYADAIDAEIARSDTSKLELITSGLAFAAEQPFFGVGRGGFSAAFVERMGTLHRFAQPENIIAHWGAEWGLVLTAVLLLVLGRTTVRSFWQGRGSLRAAALLGVGALAGHNLVDFSLELIGVSAVAAVLFGAAIAPRYRTDSENTDVRSRFGVARVTLAAAVVCGAATLTLGLSLHARSVVSLQAELSEMIDGESPDEFAELTALALRLHPSEPAFHLLAGVEATNRQDARALAFLGRAMQLAPYWPAPHLETARFLMERGILDQGLLELREAATRDVPRAAEVTCDVLRGRHDAALAFRAAPDEGTARLTFLDLVAECLDETRQPEDGAVADVIDRRLIRASPSMLAPRLRHGRRLMAEGHPDEALEQADLALASHPDLPEAQVLAIELLLEADRAPEARSRAQAAAERLPQEPTILAALARAEAANADAPAMREAVTQLRMLAGDSSRRHAEAYHLLGILENDLNNRRQSLAAFQNAYDYGRSQRDLARVAKLSERLGDDARAYVAYGELCRDDPDNRRACAAKERLRNRSLNVRGDLDNIVDDLTAPPR